MSIHTSPYLFHLSPHVHCSVAAGGFPVFDDVVFLLRARFSLASRAPSSSFLLPRAADNNNNTLLTSSRCSLYTYIHYALPQSLSLTLSLSFSFSRSLSSTPSLSRSCRCVQTVAETESARAKASLSMHSRASAARWASVQSPSGE